VFEHPRLRLMAPVPLNIVCCRFWSPDLGADQLDRLNAAIVADLQESGVAAPSTARLPGGLAIRVNITNHRTTAADLDRLVDAIVECGERRLAEAPSARTTAA
jgi:aromatic-L-amino-acid/L-tryptophan decarboxylase